MASANWHIGFNEAQTEGSAEMKPTITEQLNVAYEAGKFACIVSREVIIPVRKREMIREAKGGVEVQRGKKWVFAFAHQVKFAKDN